MVNTKKITHERLGSWEKQLLESHATPVILVCVGHNHVKGQIVVVTSEPDFIFRGWLKPGNKLLLDSPVRSYFIDI